MISLYGFFFYLKMNLYNFKIFFFSNCLMCNYMYVSYVVIFFKYIVYFCNNNKRLICESFI